MINGYLARIWSHYFYLLANAAYTIDYQYFILYICNLST